MNARPIIALLTDFGVVDPGVGSRRRVLCTEIDGRWFLAPDNGVLKFVAGQAPPTKTFVVTNRKYFLAVTGSSGLIEISLRNANAARRLRANLSNPLTVRVA